MRSFSLLSERSALLVPFAGDGDGNGNRGNGNRGRAAARLCVDTESKHVYAALVSADQPTATIFRIGETLSGGLDVAEVLGLPDSNGFMTSDLDDAAVAGIQFVADSQALCVAMHSGDIVLVHLDGPEGAAPHIENVGVIDGGIRAMEWSPDSELVLFVTGNGTILEMTKDFDVICEVPIDVDAQGEAVPVSIGWGKKETQFHGTEGKLAAKQSNQPQVDKTYLSPEDDHVPRLSWRGDGNYFVCSTVDAAQGQRKLRIYNRESVLQSTSEFVAELEHPLSWRPSGNLIASTQRHGQLKREVVFFEKNGLRHGQFALANPDDIVLDMQWNADSTALALLVSRPASDSHQPNPALIQIWTANNYHWYLKQEIRAEAGSTGYNCMLWDPEAPHRLHALLNDGEYRRFDYIPEVYTSSSLSASSSAVVAVIDGAKLLLTPFRHKNVPPPMSFASIALPAPAKFVAFAPSSAASVNAAAILLADGTVHFWDKIDQPSAAVQHLGHLVLPAGASPRQIAWTDADTVLVLQHDAVAGTDVVKAYTFDRSASPFAITKTAEISHAERRVFFIRIYHNVASGIVALQTAGGKIFQVSQHDGEWYSIQKQTLPAVCPWMASVELGPTLDTKEVAWIGLSERNKLFVNDRTLSNQCTSFTTHDEFLILTTLSHTARFLPLSLPSHEFLIAEPTAPAAGFDEQHRRVERGSQIVVAVPAGVTLVLQMPRGNLETISPRALVLSTVRHAIDRLNYRTAFIACRKHRIDMNLLVDHDPDRFREHVADFVKQIDDPDYLNLIISSLRNEDVTKTMYPVKAVSSTRDVSNKVNDICTLMATVLDKLDAERYIQSILTSDARRLPPDLEGAMRRIYAVKEKQSPEAAESALKYLIFLADVNKLYDVALGMYDFALVLMVAQHSQKDPRDYLPFLSELQKLPKYYQRHRIDDHLGRRESALRNLSLAGEDRFDETVRYMRRHQLYATGMTLYGEETTQHRTILVEFAAFHASNSAYDEAGMLYTLAGELPLALEMYTNAGLWRQAYTVALDMGASDAEIRGVAESLLELLTENRDFLNAAHVCLEMLADPTRAVTALVAGHHWADAILVCTRSRLPDLRATVVKPSAITVGRHLLDEITEMGGTYTSQRHRLRQVRLEKTQRAADAAAGVPDSRLDDIDMFSDTASMATTRVTGSMVTSRASMSTTKTGRTSKQRRKYARRRAAGKEAAFEDEFLLTSLAKLVTRSNTIQTELQHLLPVLAGFGDTRLVRDLQRLFRATLGTLADGLDEIFVKEPAGGDGAAAAAGATPAATASATAGDDGGDVDAPTHAPVVVPRPVMITTTKWWMDSF
ncbi:IKI3 family-domain-containing protein [Entophlyctis helioformis]|nr:IKI3 family-domain-containing protein [Entophlyctis helioformis]